MSPHYLVKLEARQNIRLLPAVRFFETVACVFCGKLFDGPFSIFHFCKKIVYNLLAKIPNIAADVIRNLSSKVNI